MADLMKDANYLRYYYTSEAMNLDKDICKDKTYLDYQKKCGGLMMIPMGLTVAQISLLGKDPSIFSGTYMKIRVLKTIALGGALALCLNESVAMRKQLTYYDRFYPEATQLQKQLTKEAQIFAENEFENETVEQRLRRMKDPSYVNNYRQFYQLPPAKTMQPDHLFNANADDHLQQPSAI